MRWRMRIGHYEASTSVVLEDGRLAPTAETDELRRFYAHPGMTDEDLFCLTFHEFSRSIKVAALDECPLTPREVYDRGVAVWKRAQAEKTRRSRERGKRRRAMNDYKELCETMFQDWKEGKPVVPEGFLPDHSPEPYLTFGYDSLDDLDGPALVFLTTNPGGGMDAQTRDKAGEGPYAAFQSGLVKTVYDGPDFKGPAADRIKRMKGIAEGLFGAPSFVQCEAVPFHSASLPDKAKLDARLRDEDPQSPMNAYLESLSGFLKGHHVIALDASNSLGDPARLWQGWIGRKAGLFGFRTEDAGRPYSKRSEAGNDSAHLYHYRSDGLIRAYYLTQGTNNFGTDIPGIVDAIKADGPL